MAHRIVGPTYIKRCWPWLWPTSKANRWLFKSTQHEARGGRQDFRACPLGPAAAKLHENRSTSDKLELANDANSFDFSTT